MIFYKRINVSACTVVLRMILTMEFVELCDDEDGGLREFEEWIFQFGLWSLKCCWKNMRMFGELERLAGGILRKHCMIGVVLKEFYECFMDRFWKCFTTNLCFMLPKYCWLSWYNWLFQLKSYIFCSLTPLSETKQRDERSICPRCTKNLPKIPALNYIQRGWKNFGLTLVETYPCYANDPFSNFCTLITKKNTIIVVDEPLNQNSIYFS